MASIVAWWWGCIIENVFCGSLDIVETITQTKMAMSVGDRLFFFNMDFFFKLRNIQKWGWGGGSVGKSDCCTR